MFAKSRSSPASRAIIFILFCFALVRSSFAQQPDGLVWAKAIGGDGANGGGQSAIDNQGNIYTIGSFIGTEDLDHGSGEVTVSGSPTHQNFFIAKINSTGGFEWAKGISGTPGAFVSAKGIAIDKNNNLLITGSLSGGGVDFDPGPRNTSGFSYWRSYNLCGEV